MKQGTKVANYQIESLVGQGAMATVYRAIQTNLNRTVALKTLPSEFAEDTEFVKRFFNEARAAAALSHSNIVLAYDAGISDDNICYFAMEYVEGENLLQRIDREGPMSNAWALQIMLEMAQALAYGYEAQHLTHGDLKPANIMISYRGETKLTDFGLAKIEEFDTENDGIMLTPLYAAPELIENFSEATDCRADIYSFGATLYHLLVGEPPFPEEDPEKVMDQQLYSALTPAIERQPTITQDISDWLDYALQKSPDKRPQSWQEVIEDITELYQNNIQGLATAVKSKKQSEQYMKSSMLSQEARDRVVKSERKMSSLIFVIGAIVFSSLIILLFIIYLFFIS